MAWLGAFEKLLGRGGQAASLVSQEVSQITEDLTATYQPDENKTDEINDTEEVADIPENTSQKSRKETEKGHTKGKKRRANIENRMELLTKMYTADRARGLDDDTEDEEEEEE